MLVAVDVIDADPFHVVERRAQPHSVGDIAGAGLETCGRRVVVVFSNVTFWIMLPPPCHGRHDSSNSLLAEQDADARRAEHLVAGEDEEVAVERLHIDAHVRDRLRAVHQHARADRCAISTISRAGVTVPSALETCENDTSFVRGPSSF